MCVFVCVQLMHESDPGSLDRLTYVEAAQQLEMAGQASEAKEVRRKLRQAAGQPLDEPPPPREHQIQQLDGMCDEHTHTHTHTHTLPDAYSHPRTTGHN